MPSQTLVATRAFLAAVAVPCAFATLALAGPAPVFTSSVVTTHGTGFSLGVGGDGLPVVSFSDTDARDVKVVHCGNAACSAGNVTTTVAAAESGVVESGDLAIGTDGLPVISYVQVTYGGPGEELRELKVIHCGNAACDAGNTVTTIETQDTPGQSRIAIGADGNPVIAYVRIYQDASLAWQGDLRLARCGEPACATVASVRTLATTAGPYGSSPSLGVGGDGLPVVSFYDSNRGQLMVAHCADAACDAPALVTLVDGRDYNAGFETSLAIGADGFPVIAYLRQNVFDLKLANCGNAACTAETTVTTVRERGNVGLEPSISIGGNALPAITYYDYDRRDIRLARCADADCASGTTFSAVDSKSAASASSEITEGPDGRLLVAYGGDDLPTVRVAREVPPGSAIPVNGGFERGTTVPMPWSASGLEPGDGRSCTAGRTGGCSLLLTGTGATKTLTQTVNLGGRAGDTITVAGWSRASGALPGGGDYGILVRVQYKKSWYKTVWARFPKSTHGWLRSTASVIPDEDYSRVEVALVYANQGGRARFDDIRLVRTPAP